MTNELAKLPPIRSNRMVIEYRAAGEIHNNPIALKQHSKSQIKQLMASVQAFGMNSPLLIDQNNNILAGHALFTALRRLNHAEIPVVRVSHLTEHQRSAFMIALNRLAEHSKWDEVLLASQLKILSEAELDFDLGVIGFTMAEIDLKIEAQGVMGQDQDEEMIEGQSGPAVSKLDDLWILGRHRLLCGDALDGASMKAPMKGERASQVFTYPPFNVKISGHVSGLGKIKHREFAQASGEKSSSEFVAFLDGFIRNTITNCKDGTLLYLCMDWRHMTELLAEATANGLTLINLCVWVKPNGGMGSLYRSQYELVFVFKHGKAPHQNNIELGRFERNRSNVWAYAASPGFGRAGDEGHLAALHPTVKPLNMVTDAILDSSRRGEIILDPFFGQRHNLDCR